MPNNNPPLSHLCRGVRAGWWGVVCERAMDYRFSIVVPAGTAEDSPAEEIVQLTQGTITGGCVRFPSGSVGLVHLAMFHQEQQIYPLNRGASYIGDGTDIPLGGKVALAEPPYKVKLRGWSPSATLDHTVYIEFTVERRATVPSASLPQAVALPEGF